MLIFNYPPRIFSSTNLPTPPHAGRSLVIGGTAVALGLWGVYYAMKTQQQKKEETGRIPSYEKILVGGQKPISPSLIKATTPGESRANIVPTPTKSAEAQQVQYEKSGHTTIAQYQETRDPETGRREAPTPQRARGDDESVAYTKKTES